MRLNITGGALGFAGQCPHLISHHGKTSPRLTRALAALNAHVPTANVEINVDLKKPVRLPGEVILLSSEAGASGDFQLNGHGDLVHMIGQWRRGW